jgi:hypothetical protein
LNIVGVTEGKAFRRSKVEEEYRCGLLSKMKDSSSGLKKKVFKFQGPTKKSGLSIVSDDADLRSRLSRSSSRRSP